MTMLIEHAHNLIVVTKQVLDPGLEGGQTSGIHVGQQIIVIDEEVGQVPDRQVMMELLEQGHEGHVHTVPTPALYPYYIHPRIKEAHRADVK